MQNTALLSWGATDSVLSDSEQFPNLKLARVVIQERGQYIVVTDRGEIPATLAGKLLYSTDEITALPGVGDWVMVAGDDDLAVILEILPRSSCIVRKAAGPQKRAQVIATNVDTVFICMSLNENFNLRRLERYLAVVWESGATPVVVLTKADLAVDLDKLLAEVAGVAIGVEVVTTSAIDHSGFEQMRAHLGEGKTIAFIGSSGVGKSTLVNTLVGEEILATSGLRNDGQGRHTTTHREAIRLPGGGVLIDTPGMRELGLESADLDRTFSDIDGLAAGCRFSDCTHQSEPGCAVQAAIRSGDLDSHRLASWRKLSSEVSYAGKSSKQIEEEKMTRMFGGKSKMKAKRKEIAAKTRNRVEI